VEPTSPQYAFLAAALAAVDRSITPWLIVAFHRPMYYGSTRDANFAQFEALLMQYQVDLVLTGHVHYAMVYCPIYQGACVTAPSPGAYDAPVHVIIGHAGQTLTPPVDPAPIIRWQDSTYGYSTVNIASAELLTMNIYADAGDQLIYAFNITRTFPRT
jgi:acid phosphatase type 7